MRFWRVRFRALRAPDKFLLTKPNTFQHNREAGVATLRWCSESFWNAVRLPSGTSVQLHRNPQNERNALKIMELVGSRRENANQHPALASHSFVPCGFRVKTQAEGAPLHAHRNSLVPASSHRVFPVRVPVQETLPGTFENKVVLRDEFYRETVDILFPRIWNRRKALPRFQQRCFVLAFTGSSVARGDPKIDARVSTP
jgi:hypothetical protein